MKVSVVKVELRDLLKDFHFYGTVIAEHQIAVSTDLIGKEVISVNVNPGDRVEKGQVLASLEQVNVQAEYLQHEAKLKQAELSLRAKKAALQEAANSLKRFQFLSAQRALSQQELEKQKTLHSTASSQYESALAEIRSLSAKLAELQHNKQKTQIIAPFSGIILDKMVEEGALTTAKPMFTMIRDNAIEIDANVSLEELKFLTIGQAVEVRAAQQTLQGSVRLIYPALDEKTGLGRVKIQLENKDHIPLGSFVELYAQVLVKRKASALPRSAVMFDSQGKAQVKTVDEQGKVRTVAVVTGYASPEQIELLSELPAGYSIIRKADALVNDGDLVSPVFFSKSQG